MTGPILLLNQFFPPDRAPTGQLLADVARRLAAQGHAVTVICGRNRYLAGTEARGDDEGTGPWPQVIRLPDLRFSSGGVARLLSHLSYLVGAMLCAPCVRRPEVVVSLTSPPLLCVVGAVIQRLRGARHYLWEMDLYPDVAVALGVLKPGSPFTRLLCALANSVRRRADGVIALGPCMRDRLLAQGIPPERIHVVENWADGALIQPRPFPGEMGTGWAVHGGTAEPVPTSPLTLLYSGNLGRPHEADTICAAMRRLNNDARFRFVFAGFGSRRQAVEDFCRAHGITNVCTLPFQERANLAGHLAACHVGLVTQHPATLGSIVPSKIYGLMAAARPVIFIGPRESTPALTLERFHCGWQVDPGDAGALVSLLELLAADPALLREAGARARQAFLEHYDLPAGVARICSILGLAAPEPLPARPIPVTTPETLPIPVTTPETFSAPRSQ